MNQNEIYTPATSDWRPLCKVGAVAAFAMLVIMILQIIVFVVWPPPTTVTGFFQLFQKSPVLGLLSLDLLYIINNTLLILFYLGLFSALQKTNFAAVLIALVLGLVGITTYYSSNTAFEMLSLANQYSSAAGDAQRNLFLAAGQGLLETYKGTAFDVYYVLNGITLLIFAVVILRSSVFSRTTAVFGLAAGVLMSIPSTVGTIGLVFSLLSLIPWAVFSILAAIRMMSMASKST